MGLQNWKVELPRKKAHLVLELLKISSKLFQHGKLKATRNDRTAEGKVHIPYPCYSSGKFLLACLVAANVTSFWTAVDLGQSSMSSYVPFLPSPRPHLIWLNLLFSANSLLELPPPSPAVSLSLLASNAFWNFASPWLHWFLNTRDNPCPHYFWKERKNTWLCTWKEEVTIDHVLLSVSSFSFKSPILLTCFMHISCCMP